MALDAIMAAVPGRMVMARRRLGCRELIHSLTAPGQAERDGRKDQGERYEGA